MDKLEELYGKAISAAKEMPPEKKRKLLEELAWDNARVYGPGSRGVDDHGVRWLNTPGSGFMTPVHQVTEAALLRASDLDTRGGLPYYVGNVTREMLVKKKVTIYKRGEFGMGHGRIEASAYFLQSRPWAQYKHAFEVTYLPKGAKKMRHFIETSHPTTLILEGWGHPPSFVEMMTTPVSSGSVVTSRSRHLSHSPEWDKEFSGAIEPYIKSKKVKVVLDLRSEP